MFFVLQLRSMLTAYRRDNERMPRKGSYNLIDKVGVANLYVQMACDAAHIDDGDDDVRFEYECH